MNDLDFSFEDSPWEAFLRTKRAGDTVSAANLLTMLEEENEQVVEDALQALGDGGLNLDQIPIITEEQFCEMIGMQY